MFPTIVIDVCGTGILGVVLLLFNVPTLMALLCSTLRVRYAVLAALLFACALNGVQCLGHFATTVIVLLDPSSGNKSENALSCMSNPANLLDQFTFTAVPVMLMMVSIDRWLVFTYPLQYCHRMRKYVATQIASAYIFTLLVQAISIAWTGLYNRRAGAVICAKANYMPTELYTLLVIIRVTAAALSIVFMLIVLFKLKLRVETTALFRTDSQLRTFMRRQRAYTSAMLISCGFTFGNSFPFKYCHQLCVVHIWALSR
ncbi:unnamed protein product [Toxocara canis]|uniref:G_PROTEIN_RECEP_F1_2 domain-containing protein n=1 Tax=Toxocara canis TaxID=6265 RepID=A0A183V1W7_TOXCA|nr:unnamed protein product [Toxocara canis]